MGLIITSTDKSVTLSRQTDEVYAKNRVNFDQVKTTIYFKIGQEELFNEEVTGITVNGTQLTTANAKGLLSDALFRNASGGDVPGGDNWEQTDF
ncbi:hypothetical protein M2138_001732 [Dysgonomonadaceae bacterium PH5-43]|nr:hypothetical protein [Dysgonomonadaceae bacterium PH5-43]